MSIDETSKTKKSELQRSTQVIEDFQTSRNYIEYMHPMFSSHKNEVKVILGRDCGT